MVIRKGLRMRRFTPAVAALILLPLCAAAQDSADVLARMKAMEARIEALEMEIQTLKGQPPVTCTAAAAPTPQPAPVAQAKAPQTQAAAAEAQAPQSAGVLGG